MADKLVFDLMVMVLCGTMQGCFCGSVRTHATVSTQDYGENLSTKYQYRVIGVKGLLHHSAYGFWRGIDIDNTAITYELKARYPNVFSDSGLPLIVNVQPMGTKSRNGWTVFLTIISATLYPNTSNISFSHDVDLTVSCDVGKEDCIPVVDVKMDDRFSVVKFMDSAVSIFPTALIPYGAIPYCGANPVWGQKDKVVGSDNGVLKSMSNFNHLNSGLLIDAFTYGVVAKLKEMECSGRIDSMLRKKDLDKSAVPTHALVNLVREAGNEFTYGFTLELSAEPDNPDMALSAILKEFGQSLKEEYTDSFPGANKAALIVDYLDVGISGTEIKGRAVVMIVAPVSLSYDAITRRGKLAVRFNERQMESARSWIRKNIETLARDKNIALVTGNPPPEATYYSLGEKIEGDVMEIEFKTE